MKKKTKNNMIKLNDYNDYMLDLLLERVKIGETFLTLSDNLRLY